MTSASSSLLILLLRKMAANAEEAGYKLLDRKDLYSSEHGIGGVRGTKEALRWAFYRKTG